MSEKVQITIKNKVGEKYADLQTKIITPSKETQVVTPDEGYYGLREVVVSPPVIDGEEIINKVNEISETLSESYIGGDAKASEILEGKTAYVKGKKVQGTMEKYRGTNKIEIQKDEVGTYTLSTANKYVESDINVEIVEKKTTPYDYFKNILDNDIGPEDYPYKCMIVIPFFINNNLRLNSTYRFKLNNEIVLQNTLDCSTLNEVEVFDSIYNQNTKFKYVIFYKDLANSTLNFLSSLWFYIVYCILSDNNLGAKTPSMTSSRNCTYFRKTNLINFYDASFYNNNKDIIEDDVIVVRPISSQYGPFLLNNTFINSKIYIENESVESERNVQIDRVKAREIIFKKRTPIFDRIENADNFDSKLYNTIINCELPDGLLPSYYGTYITNFINLKFYNIRDNTIIGYGNTTGMHLTYESIIHTIRELVNVGSIKTLTIGSYNKLKIQDTYVKLLDITPEMIEEDEYAVQKKPFIICDKEDEGAMTLDEYVALKNWKIA